MKNSNTKQDFPEKFSNRDSLIKTNAELIETLQKRVSGTRFRPQEGEGLKIAYYRLLLNALQVQNSIIKDHELDEMKKRIEALEAAQDINDKSIYELVGGIQ